MTLTVEDGGTIAAVKQACDTMKLATPPASSQPSSNGEGPDELQLDGSSTVNMVQ